MQSDDRELILHLDGRIRALRLISNQSAINQPLAINEHLDGRIRALRVEHDELGAIDVDVLEGEALGRHLMREAISMQSACNRHALAMQSACNRHLLAAGQPRVRQVVENERLPFVEEPEHCHDGAVPPIDWGP